MDENAEIRKLIKVFYIKDDEDHGLSSEELLELKINTCDTLVDLLSPIDNAKNFIKNMNGIELIFHLLSPTNDDELIAGGLDILSTVTQNNPEPQKALLAQKPLIFKVLIQLGGRTAIGRKALGAISALTSSSSTARNILIQQNATDFFQLIKTVIQIEEENTLTFRSRKKALFILPHIFLRDAGSISSNHVLKLASDLTPILTKLLVINHNIMENEPVPGIHHVRNIDGESVIVDDLLTQLFYACTALLQVQKTQGKVNLDKMKNLLMSENLKVDDIFEKRVEVLKLERMKEAEEDGEDVNFADDEEICAIEVFLKELRGEFGILNEVEEEGKLLLQDVQPEHNM